MDGLRLTITDSTVSNTRAKRRPSGSSSQHTDESPALLLAALFSPLCVFPCPPPSSLCSQKSNRPHVAPHGLGWAQRGGEGRPCDHGGKTQRRTASCSLHVGAEERVRVPPPPSGLVALGDGRTAPGTGQDKRRTAQRGTQQHNTTQHNTGVRGEGKGRHAQTRRRTEGQAVAGAM
jgi:hypothetical protein